ncbi:MAG: alginate lyase family protein [Acidobacteriaceae bacterium]
MLQLSVMSRRRFCKALVASAISVEVPIWGQLTTDRKEDAYRLVARTDRKRILKAAAVYVTLPIRTITSFPSSRSPGGLHDYFSEADYFWPNPKNPDGPYINRDGQSNPANFNGHRNAMIALSIQMPVLTAAWLLTGNRRYGRHACEHLRAWFSAPATRMNPNLEYSQGVHGVSSGRSYGIIDTVHLVEVARAASIVTPSMLSAKENAALKGWFRSYLHWMKTSAKGRKERDARNNHATCWALQASEFARLIGDGETRSAVHREYENVLLPDQMAKNGSFPKELARTKPYSYSIFNFDMMATLCQSLKGLGNDSLTFHLPDGRGTCRAAEFIYPYLKDKSAWPYSKDVEHFDAFPVRSPGLLFAGLACHRQPYIALWKTMDPDPTDPEIVRNYPIRQPLLWVG